MLLPGLRIGVPESGAIPHAFAEGQISRGLHAELCEAGRAQIEE